MKRSALYRWLFYLAGLLILALGITLNTKVGLGVSPIVSVSYCVSQIWERNFGNATLVLYSLFVVVELALHIRMGRRDGLTPSVLRTLLLKDVLQFPLSLIFTRFMNLFSAFIPELTGDMGPRLLVLFLGISCTGVGAALSLDMRLVPNPGDGIVQTLADTVNQSTGLVKNCFDAFNIVVTTLIGLIFAGRIIGIGVGTLLAVLGVGRVMALFNHLFQEKLMKLAGLS